MAETVKLFAHLGEEDKEIVYNYMYLQLVTLSHAKALGENPAAYGVMIMALVYSIDKCKEDMDSDRAEAIEERIKKDLRGLLDLDEESYMEMIKGAWAIFEASKSRIL